LKRLYFKILASTNNILYFVAMANVVKIDGFDWEFEVEHKTLTQETAQSIFDCLQDGINFSLSCELSMIVFSPANLWAVWIGRENAVFSYPSLNEMQIDISMRLLTHKQFTRLGGYLAKEQVLAISLPPAC
jgi:hypothetical protein